MSDETFSTACPRNCYSTCSFRVRVRNNRLVGIDAHPANLATPLGPCLKGLAYVERTHSPQRILYPMRRVGKAWQRVSWPEALAQIAERLVHFRNAYGPHSIFFLTGSGMSGLLNGFSSRFWRHFGGATTTYGNLCWPAGLEATRLTLGANLHNAPWDLENARLVVVWGKNLVETNIHQSLHLEKALARGARLVYIDPRRTATAEKADLFLQPRPGTDAALALAVAHVLIENGWYDAGFVHQHVLGFEAYAHHLRDYTPQWAASACDVPAAQIQTLAQWIGSIGPMTLVVGYGMQRFSNGGQTVRAILALSVLTGNIGKPGACWHYANLQSYVFDSVKEPLSYYPDPETDAPLRRRISMARLGQDMLDAHDPPLKMVWVERGNPLSQNPDSNTIRRAFHGLEFRVVVDQFFTDTAQEADLVLPAKTMFEQSDLIGGYWNPYVQLKPKVLDPPGEVKPETEIYWSLAQQLGWSEAELHQHLLPPGDAAAQEYLRYRLATFPELSWQALTQGPQLPPGHQELAFADMRFPTPSGKIELLSDQASALWGVAALPDYVPLTQRTDEQRQRYPYQLLSPNTKNRIHSQFGNLEIIRHFAPYPEVFMHPQLAAQHGIEHGSWVRVYNDQGSFELRAHLQAGQRPDCVLIYNGWWAQEGGSTNNLSLGRHTDMGHGTAFHDTFVQVERIR